MFERFTDRARRVVVLAQEEARMMTHNYIGTEHLLLALSLPEGVGKGGGVGGNTPAALAKIGLDHETIREKVLAVIGEGTHAPPGHIPFTPRAKKVLEGALREALSSGHNYISPDHLLMSLVNRHLGDGVAGDILLEQTPEDAIKPLVFNLALEKWFTWEDRPDKVPNTGEVDATSSETAPAKISKARLREILAEQVALANDDKLMLLAMAMGYSKELFMSVDWSS